MLRLMASPNSAPTIQDVARHAGVSPATVSSVINGKASVSEISCQAVRDAMAALNYTPPPLGRRRGPRSKSSRLRRTNRVALITTSQSSKVIEAPVYASVLHGVESAMSAAGMSLMLRHIPADQPPKNLFPSRVDGVLILGSVESASLRSQLEATPSVRIMGAPSPEDTWDHVTYDNSAIGKLAATTARQLGCRRLAYLAADGAQPAFIAARGEDFAAALKRDGITCTRVGPFPLTILSDHEHGVSKPALEHLADALLAATPDCLFLPMDMWTVALQGELQRRGVDLERRLRLISCNNERILLAALHPRPVSIDIQAATVGRRGAQQLLWRLEHPDETRVVQLIVPQLP